MKALHKAGADIRIQEKDKLLIAADRRNIKVLDCLSENGASPELLLDFRAYKRDKKVHNCVEKHRDSKHAIITDEEDPLTKIFQNVFSLEK